MTLEQVAQKGQAKIWVGADGQPVRWAMNFFNKAHMDDRVYGPKAMLLVCKRCAELGLRHIRTKPYTPKTNGKAERFIQTSLREWAYARAYNTSNERAAELPRWLHRYNWHRPHGSIGSKPPISRLGLTGNNLLRLHN